MTEEQQRLLNAYDSIASDYLSSYGIDLTNISEENAPYFENAVIEVMKKNPGQEVKVTQSGAEWAASHHPGKKVGFIHFDATAPAVIDSTVTGLLEANKIRPQDIVRGILGQSDPQKLQTLANYFGHEVQKRGGWDAALQGIEGITDEDDPL
jgi:hypothetical protein